MKYRRFGRTEIQMPVFSCGGMRYQHKWDDINPEDVPEEGQRNLEATILRALELGINHIETARGYGSSEMQLGWILPRQAREKMIVQTKIAPFATAEEFVETFETSMRYLKLDHVDLLSLHGINNAELLDWTLRKGGCLDAARRLQREGRCRHIGFSTHATADIILRTIGTGEFDYVNLHWYFVNDFNWPAVEAAAAQDMGMFIISPNDKGGMLYAPPAKLRDLCAPLTPMAFNDLYCLARPQIHTLSIGAARPEDFDAHIAALAHYEAARGDRTRAWRGVDARVGSRLAELHRYPRRSERAGNRATLAFRKGARSHRVGKDALQSHGQRRPLVPRRERRKVRRETRPRRARQPSIRRPHPRHPQRSPRDAARRAAEAAQRKRLSLLKSAK